MDNIELPQIGPSNKDSSGYDIDTWLTLPNGDYSNRSISDYDLMGTIKKDLHKRAEGLGSFNSKGVYELPKITNDNIESISGFATPMQGTILGAKGIERLVGNTYEAFKAERALENGVEARAVFTSTGYQKQNGNIVKVLDDIKSDINLEKLHNENSLFNIIFNKNRGAKASDLITNKDLIKAYPELKDLSVRMRKEGGESYYLEGEGITLANRDKKTFAHEIQHFIDSIEGFSTGANVGEYNQVGNKFASKLGIPQNKYLNKALEPAHPDFISQLILKRRINKAIKSMDKQTVDKYGRENLFADLKSLNSLNIYRLNKGEENARKSGALVGNKSRFLGDLGEQSDYYEHLNKVYGEPSSRIEDFIDSIQPR